MMNDLINEIRRILKEGWVIDVSRPEISGDLKYFTIQESKLGKLKKLIADKSMTEG